MKRFIAFLLTALMLVSLVACEAAPKAGTDKKETVVTTEAPKKEEKADASQATTEATTAAATEAKVEEKSAEEEFRPSLMFCGSTSLYPIISSLAASFTDEYVKWNKVDPAFPEKNISIYVASGGSGVGAAAAIDRTADFGMIAREIKDSEKEALGEGYQEFVVARDALTVSINAENPLGKVKDDLDTDTIRKIFAGEIKTWKELDKTLPDEKINVYIRDLSGGAYEVFQKSVMGDSEVTAEATQSASMTELASNIAGDKWGIGYAGYGAFNKANKEKTVLLALKVDGVEATEENIISGEYKIQRPVMFVTGEKVEPSAQAFIDYIFSEIGVEVIVQNGYIPAFDVKK